MVESVAVELFGTIALTTYGFPATEERFDHWDDHHQDFEPPPITEDDYEELADVFLTCPKRASMLECVRANGRLCRYDTTTQEYGVLSPDRRILTYFKPDPAEHKFTTNEEYFHARC